MFHLCWSTYDLELVPSNIGSKSTNLNINVRSGCTKIIYILEYFRVWGLHFPLKMWAICADAGVILSRIVIWLYNNDNMSRSTDWHWVVVWSKLKNVSNTTTTRIWQNYITVKNFAPLPTGATIPFLLKNVL